MGSDPELRRFSAIVFFFAFALRMLVGWIAGCFHMFTRYEMVNISLSLLRSHQFANPYLIPTGLTAHEAPLYPLFLFVIYRTFGVNATAEAVKIVASCLTVALRCALLPQFCLAVGLGRSVAIASGIIASLWVSYHQTEITGNWAEPWQALALLILIWMTFRIWKEQSWVRQTPWLYMICWGLAILLQPALIPVLGALLVAGLIASPRNARSRYLRHALITALIVAGFLAPWAVRNKMALGKFIWTRSNFGLELWLSNGPGRPYDMQTNLGIEVPHPNTNLQEAQLVRTLGEIRYNQMKLDQAVSWIRGHPIEFARITAVRFLAFWFQPNRNPFKRLVAMSFTLVAFIGFGLLLRIQRLLAVLFGIVWMSFPLVYYLLQWTSRYRYTIDWQLMVCAAVTVATLWETLRNYRQRRTAGLRALETCAI